MYGGLLPSVLWFYEMWTWPYLQSLYFAQVHGFLAKNDHNNCLHLSVFRKLATHNNKTSYSYFPTGEIWINIKFLTTQQLESYALLSFFMLHHLMCCFITEMTARNGKTQLQDQSSSPMPSKGSQRLCPAAFTVCMVKRSRIEIGNRHTQRMPYFFCSSLLPKMRLSDAHLMHDP